MTQFNGVSAPLVTVGATNQADRVAAEIERINFTAADRRTRRVTLARSLWEAMPRDHRPAAWISDCGGFVQFDEFAPFPSSA